MAWAYRTGTYANDGAGFGNPALTGGQFVDTFSLGAAVVAGDRIVVAIHVTQSAPGAAPTYSVRDSVNGSAAYHEDVSLTYTDVNNIRFSVFSLANSAAGTPSISVTITPTVGGTGIFGGCAAAAYSGLLATDPGVDVSASSGSSGGSVSSGATSATTAANELVIGAYGDPGYGSTLTLGSGYTQRGKHDADGNNLQSFFEDKDSGSSGTTQTATLTNSDGSAHWGMAAVVYKLAGAGGGGTTGTLAATLAKPGLASAGAETFSGSVAANLSRVQVSASGTAAGNGSLIVNLAKVVVAASGTETFSGSLAANLQRVVVAASGATTVSISGSIAANLPRLRTGIALPFATSVSTNGRYLLDQYGQPYFIQGDSPQNMAAMLTPAQMGTFFSGQASRGNNSSQIHFFVNDNMSANVGGINVNGDAPFTNMSTLSGPVEAYWTIVDQMLSLAEQNGITVWASPVDYISWHDTLGGMTVAQCVTFGQFIGNRYKSRPNIIWSIGNDWGGVWPQMGAGPFPADDKHTGVMQGIRDTGDTHMLTLWLWPDGTSWDNSAWDDRVSATLEYAYSMPWYASEKGYTSTSSYAPKPTFFGEGNYEGQRNYAFLGGGPTTNYTLRLTAWWPVTWGACGQFFGQDLVWNLASGYTSVLVDSAAQENWKVRQLITSLPGWQLLVPDFTHTLITSGYGTHDTSSTVGPELNDFATASISSAHDVAVIYAPSVRSWTLNTGVLSGTVTGYWFDPTTGTTTAASSPWTIPSTAHSDGTHDWVLVLQGSGGGVTGTLASTLQRLQVSAAGSVGGPSVSGTLTSTLQRLQAVGSGTVSTPGGLIANLPRLQVAASGTVTTNFLGSLASNLPSLSVASTGTETFSGSSSVVLQRVQVFATQAYLANLGLTLQRVTLAAQGSVSAVIPPEPEPIIPPSRRPPPPLHPVSVSRAPFLRSP